MMSQPLLTVWWLLLLPATISATFTIAASDSATQQVGGAGSTCVESDGESLYAAAYFSIPGKAVLHAQALTHDRDSPIIALALEMMENGTSPEEILDVITSADVDSGNSTAPSFPLRDVRQYGLVNVEGEVAGYTGGLLDALYTEFGFQPSYQTDEQGTLDSYTFTAQGNVVSEATVPTLVSAFQSDTDCDDLAQRLYNAVVATHDAPEGDVRCENKVGSIAFLQVDGPDGSAIVSIDVTYDIAAGSVDPFIALKASFAEWRAANPCSGGESDKTSDGDSDGGGGPAVQGTDTSSALATLESSAWHTFSAVLSCFVVATQF